MKKFIISAGLFALLLLAVPALAGHNADGLAGYWNFDDDTADPTLDSSGHGNDGAISGAAYAGSGAPFPGNVDSLDFDGVDDVVTVPDAAELDISAAITVSGWINLDSTAMQGTVAAKWRDISGANERGYLLTTALDGTPRFYISSTGANFPSAVGAALSTGVWYHLAGTYDGIDIKLYVDGVLVATTPHAGSIFLNNEPVLFGANDGFGGSTRKYTNGKVDEVHIYDRALSADEIAILAGTSGMLFVSKDGQVGFGSVDCDGVGISAYTTIQDAVNAASSGDTVIVCPDEYAENVSVTTDGITIMSSESVESQGVNTSVVGSGAAGNIFTIIADGVTVKGFKISGAIAGGAEVGHGVRVVGNNNTAAHNTVTDNDRNGIRIFSGTGNDVHHNNVTENNMGIVLRPAASENTVQSNVVKDNIVDGIRIFGDLNVIHHNNACTNPGDDISLFAGSEGNHVHSNQAGILDAGDNRIRKNSDCSSA